MENAIQTNRRRLHGRKIKTRCFTPEFIGKRTAKYLGRTRVRLLNELAHASALLLTRRRIDSFTQMTVEECEEFVNQTNLFMVELDRLSFKGDVRLVLRRKQT